MKTNKFPAFIWALFSCFAIPCYAQDSKTFYHIDSGILSGGEMTEGIRRVNLNALRDFMKRFPLATGVKWKMGEDNYTATFIVNSNENLVVYQKNGKWAYTINRYDNEKMLPTEVRALVKKTYYDYTILHIDEIHVFEHENTIYLVNIQDGRKIKTVRVCNGELEIIRELVKDN